MSSETEFSIFQVDRVGIETTISSFKIPIKLKYEFINKFRNRYEIKQAFPISINEIKEFLNEKEK